MVNNTLPINTGMMTGMMGGTQIIADPKEALIQMITTEMRRGKDRLAEMRSQIDQTQLSVDREQQRNSDIMIELRTVQDNLDTVPRADIRAKYDEAMDARFRLTTMRGQLEKLQSVRDQLEQQQTLFANMLTILQGADAIDSPDDAKEGISKGGVNVIRVIQAQEEERQRLSRQMHDGPAQSMTNFILQAEICQRLFDVDPARAADELGDLKQAASVTFQKIRDFIFDLRPMMLDDLGVVPTVRRYVNSFREKNDIEVELEILGEDRRLQSHQEVMMFRAIQELLVHTRDYANASSVKVRLDLSGQRAKASVEDNGKGFDVQIAFALVEEGNNDPRIHGLVNLMERFELVNGTVVIDSSEAEGTTVRLELPLDS